MISLSQCRRYPTREWNRASPEYRLEALPFGLLAVVESCKTCVRVCNSPRLPTNNRLDQRFLAVPIIKFSPDAFLPSFNCASSWVQQRIKEREYSSARNLDQEWRKSKKCVCVCMRVCACVLTFPLLLEKPRSLLVRGQQFGNCCCMGKRSFFLLKELHWVHKCNSSVKCSAFSVELDCI